MTMKILTPVDGPGEVASLSTLGAREFYGGYLPRRWNETFTLAASANRRSFDEAQMSEGEELRAVVDAVHERGGKFFLTVNSPFYTAEQFPPLLELVGEAVDIGVDALIAADIGFILAARERWPDIPVHLSTMAEVTNSAAVAFYGHLGIGRITFPRHLTLGELERIVAKSEGVRFDVFILYGQCVNAEGLCTFSHDDPRRVWPCVQPYRVTSSGAGRREGGGEAPALCGQMLWPGLPRGEACGLCGLWELDRLGIESVKIVGRGTSTERKEWAVGTVADLLSLLREGASKEEFRSEARRLYGARFPKGCRPMLCYFPELLPGDGG